MNFTDSNRRRHGGVWGLSLVALWFVGGASCRRGGHAADGAASTDSKAPTQISIGGTSACAVLRDGTVQCWGDNGYGQLGDGSSNRRLVPGPVPGLTDVVQVEVGDVHACARKRDGAVLCWGAGAYGQNGSGGTSNVRSPAPVVGLPPASFIGTGGENTCAVALDGAVWCWGSNVFGESAQPAEARSVMRPTRVAGLGPAVQVDTGQNHACALLRDGSVWCWGIGGPLGDGASENRRSPVQVVGVSGATAIAVGQNHNCALLPGGAVACAASRSTRASATAVCSPFRSA